MFDRQFNRQNADAHDNNGLSPIPSGDYAVRIVKSEYAVSKTSGKEMIVLELEIQGGKHAGRRLWYRIVDDEYADSKVMSIMTSCGQGEPQRIWPGLFDGLLGHVHTKVWLYNGKEQADVSYWIRPRDNAAPHPPVDPAMGPATAPTNPDDIPF